MFELADCEEKAGKISSAFNHYHQYLIEVDLLPPAKVTANADRVKRAEAALNALRDEIPTLRVVVPISAPADIVIMRDSITLAPASFGVPMPVDPGKHIVKALAKDGQTLFQQEIESKRKDAQSVEVNISTPAQVAPLPPPPPPPLPPMVNADNNVLRTGGYLAVGVGLTGLMTGSIFGGLSLAEAKEVEAANDPAYQKGTMLATFSNVGFVVGIAGVATGATMLVIDHVQHGKRSSGKEKRSSQRVLVDVGPGGFSVGVQGVFQ